LKPILIVDLKSNSLYS